GGNCIWFNGVVKVENRGSNPAEIRITLGRIQSAYFMIDVPDNLITFSPAATSASTVFNTLLNRWETTVPVSYSGNVFLAGVMYQVASGGLPGGINAVTWSANFSANVSGLTASWKWAAAVYTRCNVSNGGLGVKPIDGNKQNPYPNSDNAGTPESIKSYVIKGTSGNGGSNYTGGYSGTGRISVCR
ncbi:MAG: hypothetical protein AAB393_08045, partial [Bacteroidota bacterium]